MKALGDNSQKKLQPDNERLAKKCAKPIRRSSIDRRSGNDRRKTYQALYFLKGGIERRKWRERRYLWDMTM
jgi:hypothetical protein